MGKKKLSLTKIIDAELNSVEQKYATSDKWTIIEKKKAALSALYENDEIMFNIHRDNFLRLGFSAMRRYPSLLSVLN